MSDGETARAGLPSGAFAPAPAPRHGGGAGEHFVQFYDEPDSLLAALGEFVRAGLDAGEACVVVDGGQPRRACARDLRATRSTGARRAAVTAWRGGGGGGG
ncbi:MAG TPA: MEDS domain-containing protein, partial [Pyrinomonadaceae bacterium]